MSVPTDDTTTDVRLDIGGMTCASCAVRIEKKLNRLDGVSATVNYATEQARVTMPADTMAVDDLIKTVEATGYRAAVHAPVAPELSPQHAAHDHGLAAPAHEHDHPVDDAALAELRRRLLISALLAFP